MISHNSWCFFVFNFILSSLSLLFSAFPSQYFFTIDYLVIFRFREWYPYLPTEFPWFYCTLILLYFFAYALKALFYLALFIIIYDLIHFRSPLLTKSRLISFLLATKMFQFTNFFLLSCNSFLLDIFGSLIFLPYGFTLPKSFRTLIRLF